MKLALIIVLIIGVILWLQKDNMPGWLGGSLCSHLDCMEAMLDDPTIVGQINSIVDRVHFEEWERGASRFIVKDRDAYNAKYYNRNYFDDHFRKHRHEICLGPECAEATEFGTTGMFNTANRDCTCMDSEMIRGLNGTGYVAMSITGEDALGYFCGLGGCFKLGMGDKLSGQTYNSKFDWREHLLTDDRDDAYVILHKSPSCPTVDGKDGSYEHKCTRACQTTRQALDTCYVNGNDTTCANEISAHRSCLKTKNLGPSHPQAEYPS